MTDSKDSMIESDAEGNFSGEIELDSGINNLTVTALRDDGQEKSITQEVVYDDQVLGAVSNPPNKSITPQVKGAKTFVEDSLESVSKNHKVDKTTRYSDEKNQPVKPNTIKPKDRVIAIFEKEDGATSFPQAPRVIK